MPTFVSSAGRVLLLRRDSSDVRCCVLSGTTHRPRAHTGPDYPPILVRIPGGGREEDGQLPVTSHVPRGVGRYCFLAEFFLVCIGK